jgi:hypothetical protein
MLLFTGGQPRESSTLRPETGDRHPVPATGVITLQKTLSLAREYVTVSGQRWLKVRGGGQGVNVHFVFQG